jgi:phospholipase C
MAQKSDIQHFVVLMLENRSFDHFFGFFPGLGSDGLTGDEFNTLDPNNPESAKFFVSKNAPWKTSAEGPSHSLKGTNLQLAGHNNGPTSPATTKLNGFVVDYRSALQHAPTNPVHNPTPDQLGEVMASFAPEALPSINALAQQFCLCTHWHSEVPGPTQPNRLYMHAATSGGRVWNNWKLTFPWPTIYENLQKNGKTWATYQVGKDNQFNEVLEFSNINGQQNNFRRFETDFEADMRAGAFPNYSFIVPRYKHSTDGPANSQHAPDDARFGDNLIADVYEALRRNDPVWSKSVFILLYDEHGGFYDHVKPPFGVPNPDGINAPLPGDPAYVQNFEFDRLGLRVPAIIASPWVDKQICGTQLQHTSVLATVKKWFGLPKFLTKRDESAATFESLFLDEPRTDAPMTLPRTQVDPIDTSDARHPMHQLLDENRLEMIEGVGHLTGASWGSELPATHGEASPLVSRAMRQRFPRRGEGKPPKKPIKKTPKR